MAQFRNDFGEDRVVSTLGYTLVANGATFTVPDDEVEHYIAGGFTSVSPPSTAAAVPTPAKTATPAATAPEGTEVA
jgi:hypothetical protein